MSHCSICTELLRDDIAALTCGHVFHRECTLEWFKQQGQRTPAPLCALCKLPMRNVSGDVIQLTFQPMNAVKQYIKQLEEEEEKAIKEREQQQQQQQQHHPQQRPPPQWWAQDDVSMDAADASASAAAAAGRSDSAQACPSGVTAAAAASSIPHHSPLYANSLFFRIKLSALQEELEAAETLNDKTLGPQYRELMQRFADATSELDRAQKELALTNLQRREARRKRDEAEKALAERKQRIDALQRVRFILHKHKAVWSIVQLMGEKEGAALTKQLADARDAKATAAARMQHLSRISGGTDGGGGSSSGRNSPLALLAGGAGAAVGATAASSLSAQLSAGVNQFDPEKHLLFQQACTALAAAFAKDTGSPSAASAGHQPRDLRVQLQQVRLHLLQLHESFLQARMRAANASRLAKKSAVEDASHRAYVRQIARAEQALSATHKRIAQRSDEVLMLEDKLALLQRQMTTMRGTSTNPAGTTTGAVSTAGTRSAVSVAPVVGANVPIVASAFGMPRDSDSVSLSSTARRPLANSTLQPTAAAPASSLSSSLRRKRPASDALSNLSSSISSSSDHRTTGASPATSTSSKLGAGTFSSVAAAVAAGAAATLSHVVEDGEEDETDSEADLEAMLLQLHD